MTYVPSTDELLYNEVDGIGWLTFNRPQARNALTFAMYDGIGELCSLPINELPRALVLAGAGTKSFAAGTDISQFLDFREQDDAQRYEEHMSTVLNSLERCPVPTIAAIRGACTGGGAAIAAACDFRIGAPSALFGIPIARTLGNCLSIDNCSRLAAIVGSSRLTEIMFSARLVEAAESLQIGWLHEVVGDDGLLEARAQELAVMLTNHAPLTLRATKLALSRIRAASLPSGEDLIVMCYLSEDFHEGVEAFVAKRSPQWRGQ